MGVIIKKLGNRLALRIPDELARSLRVTKRFRTVSRVNNDKGIRRPRYTIEELISQLTPENIHSETKTGDRVGSEEW